MSLDRIVDYACTRGGDLRHLRLCLGIGADHYGYKDPCGVAASFGNVTVLRVLREAGVPWGRAYARAIEARQFHVVRWMLSTDTREPTDSQSTSLPKSLAYRRAALLSF